jgi:hypothetical protein
MNLNALVTATEAATRLPDVSRHLIGMWERLGKIQRHKMRGRSPLYRWGDILAVEAETRISPLGRKREAQQHHAIAA